MIKSGILGLKILVNFFRRLWFVSFGAAFLCVSTVAAFSDAEDVLPVVKIAMHDDIPPYVMDSPVRGTDVEILETVFKRVGYRVEFVIAPLLRLPVLQENGVVDAYATYGPTAEGMISSRPFRHWHDGVIVRDDMKMEKGSKEVDLTGLRVGTFPGAMVSLEDVLGSYRDAVSQAFDVETSRQAASLFSLGRIDAYVGDVYAFFYHYRMSDQKDPDYRPRIVTLFKPFPQRLIFTDPALKEAFDAALIEVRLEGLVEKVLVQNTIESLALPFQ